MQLQMCLRRCDMYSLYLCLSTVYDAETEKLGASHLTPNEINQKLMNLLEFINESKRFCAV